MTTRRGILFGAIGAAMAPLAKLLPKKAEPKPLKAFRITQGPLVPFYSRDDGGEFVCWQTKVTVHYTT